MSATGARKHMNVGWVIDGDMFPHYLAELVDAIESLGHEAKLVHAPSPPFRWDDIGCSYRDSFPADHCVMCHGDIELVTRIHDEKRWIPGAFATIENYFCSNYVSYFGEFWLNQDYILLPFCDLRRRQQFILETFGIDGKVFARPDSPLKLFTGQIVTKERFDEDVEYMGFYEFPADSLVVISSPKQIKREWRFVAACGEIVAGSQYVEHGEIALKTSVDAKAELLAKKVASLGYSPDPVWIVDICQTADDQYHLLEIGGFSFSDLYACNKLAVAKAVSLTALSEWQKNGNDSRHSK